MWTKNRVASRLRISRAAESDEVGRFRGGAVVEVELLVILVVRAIQADVLVCCCANPRRMAGGFHQYLYNSSGDTAADVLDALKLVGAPQEAADLVTEALSVFPKGPSRERSKRQKQVDALGDAALRRWRALEDRFFKLSDAFVEDFVRRHPDDFASIGSIR